MTPLPLPRRAALLGALGAAVLPASPAPAAGSAGAEALSAAARDYLAALGPRAAEARFAFGGPEHLDWHWFPDLFRGGRREGPRLGSLMPAQRDAAMALLAALTTPAGRDKAVAIMSLQADLGRDPGDYHAAVYGEPGGTRPWGVGWEGHHLALYASVTGGRVLPGPVFLGAHPTLVEGGPRAGLRAMAAEEDGARAALLALPAALRARALVADRTPGDTVTANRPRTGALPPEGIVLAEMPGGARSDLLRAIEAYLDAMPPDAADRERAGLRAADPARVRFAWHGSARPGELYYWRAQGERFLIEHDNSRDGGRHIHSVWRGFGTDFGGASPA